MTLFLQSVAESIAEETGRFSPVSVSTGIGGGCINNASRIDLEDGRSFFLKSNPASLPHMFDREAEGLKAIAAVGALRVPGVISHGGGTKGIPPFLVLEYVAPGSPDSTFQERMGRQFAELHRNSRRDRFGFDHDNYLGSTPQPNGWKDNWVEFWCEHRLGHQLSLAKRNGHADSTFLKLGDQLMNKLTDLIAEPREPACLLHGDLWGGNFMCAENGEPVLIDPAAYYGRREADLAMTMLFGGFSSDFYSAYEELWPLGAGSSERLEIYKLHHLLNHLNLFGSSYKSGCMDILRRYA